MTRNATCGAYAWHTRPCGFGGSAVGFEAFVALVFQAGNVCNGSIAPIQTVKATDRVRWAKSNYYC